MKKILKSGPLPQYLAWLLLGTLALGSTTLQAETAATVAASEGTVVVVRPDGKKRIVETGSQVHSGDAIQTEQGSSAKLRFSDGSEVAVRPATTLVVQQYAYHPTQPAKDSFVLELVRGGLRQISGLLSKRNQEAYRLRSGSATIGIRGTDFTARVCQGDCAALEKEKSAQAVLSNPLAAKVVEIAGKASALQKDGTRRDLSVGAPVFQDDQIETPAGGYVALVFRDQTRVVVPANSAFRITAYRYDKAQPEKSNVFFSMVRGGLRVVTGLLAKTAPQKIRVGTGNATIGIRGTSFDLACVAPNIPNPETGGGGTGGCGGGLYTVTRDGSISITTENGDTTVNQAGQSSYLGGSNQSPVLLRFSPEFMQAFGGPLPENIKLDIEALFGADGSNFGDNGLYVTVVDGRVLIVQANKELLLSMGESGFASSSGEILQRLGVPPDFLSNDVTQTQSAVGFQGCRM